MAVAARMIQQARCEVDDDLSLAKLLPAAVQMDKPGRIDAALLKTVARARLWFEQLAAGEASSLQAIADLKKVATRLPKSALID